MHYLYNAADGSGRTDDRPIYPMMSLVHYPPYSEYGELICKHINNSTEDTYQESLRTSWMWQWQRCCPAESSKSQETHSGLDLERVQLLVQHVEHAGAHGWFRGRGGGWCHTGAARFTTNTQRMLTAEFKVSSEVSDHKLWPSVTKVTLLAIWDTSRPVTTHYVIMLYFATLLY